MQKSKIAKVVLPIALDKEFDYTFSSDKELLPGARVVVDFRGRRRLGLVREVSSASRIAKLKPVISLLDTHPVLTREHCAFAQALSKKYPYAASEFLFMMLPAYLKKPHQFSGYQDTNVQGECSEGVLTKGSLPVNGQHVFIKADTFGERYEMWRERVREKLREGSVLICFPQRAYLEAAARIIQKDFSHSVRVLHSQMAQRDLFTEWRKSRQKALILGTRVSLFYYPRDLRLFILEEENNPHYFQQEKPFHHLFDVALLLCALKNSECVASGDLPSLGAYHLIAKSIFTLKEKESLHTTVRVVGLDKNLRRKIMTPVARELLRTTIDEGKRAVIIWDKKGFARYIACSCCGKIYTCQHCSAFLCSSTQTDQVQCPYCQRSTSLPKTCTQCKSGYLKSTGCGIERVGTIIHRTFPEVSIDTWQKKPPDSQLVLSTSRILSSLYGPKLFHRGFVLDADAYVMHSEYDATCNAFFYFKKLSLLFHDALYLFTRNPTYYLFNYLNRPWQEFYEEELALRKKFKLPPFYYLIKIVLRSRSQNQLLELSQSLYNRLEESFEDVYGPHQEYPFKLRDKFRYSLVVKSRKTKDVPQLIKQCVGDIRSSSVHVAVIIQ